MSTGVVYIVRLRSNELHFLQFQLDEAGGNSVEENDMLHEYALVVTVFDCLEVFGTNHGSLRPRLPYLDFLLF
jgi:hypothetical protein